MIGDRAVKNASRCECDARNSMSHWSVRAAVRVQGAALRWVRPVRVELLTEQREHGCAADVLIAASQRSLASFSKQCRWRRVHKNGRNVKLAVDAAIQKTAKLLWSKLRVGCPLTTLEHAWLQVPIHVFSVPDVELSAVPRSDKRHRGESPSQCPSGIGSRLDVDLALRHCADFLDEAEDAPFVDVADCASACAEFCSSSSSSSSSKRTRRCGVVVTAV